jgi:cell division protein FtsW
MSTQRNQRTGTAPKYDYLLVITAAALLIIGLMMVFSATAFKGVDYQLSDEPTYYILRQAVFSGVGLLAMFIMARIRYHTWQKFSILMLVGALLLLGLVLALGTERFGGIRWFFEGSVQPSEVARLAVIIYIADWLSSKGIRIRQVTYGLVPFGILLGLVAGLIILQPNFSIAVLIAMTAVAMFFIAGGDLWQIIASGLLSCVPLVLLITSSEYRIKRVLAFFNPLSDPSGANYQTIQSLIALASGGLLGVGPGASRQKFGYIPAAHTDNIFAVLGEEWGLIGCLMVVGLFTFLAYRGFRVAMNAPDLFGAVLASGITCSLIFQALVNMAVVTAMAPATGIPLPFISYGGSSLVTSLAGIGLLLAVSRGAPPEPAREETTTRETYDLRRWDGRSRVSRPGRHRLVDN